MEVLRVAGAALCGFGFYILALERLRARGLRFQVFDPVCMGLIAGPLAVGSIVVGGAPFVSSIVLACVGVCAATDYQTGYIFNRVTGAAATMLLCALLLERGLGQSLAGALVCGGAFMLLFAITRGRGIGLGDVKLGAIVGAVGVHRGAVALGFAFVFGAATALAGLVLGYKRFGDSMPFAPYIAAGTCVSLAFGGWPL